MATATASKKASKKNTASQTEGKAKGDLTGNEIKVLSLLAKAKAPMTRGELSFKTGINKGWSRLLGAFTEGKGHGDGLEDRGLVTTHVAPEGERGVRYTITAAGRKALAKAG